MFKIFFKQVLFFSGKSGVEKPRGKQFGPIFIEENDCTEGSVWMKQCNRCRCSHGRGLCTLKGCLGDTSSQHNTCEGNSKWRENCNWCECRNGRGVCTEYICFNGL